MKNIFEDANKAQPMQNPQFAGQMPTPQMQANQPYGGQVPPTYAQMPYGAQPMQNAYAAQPVQEPMHTQYSAPAQDVAANPYMTQAAPEQTNAYAQNPYAAQAAPEQTNTYAQNSYVNQAVPEQTNSYAPPAPFASDMQAPTQNPYAQPNAYAQPAQNPYEQAQQPQYAPQAPYAQNPYAPVAAYPAGYNPYAPAIPMYAQPAIAPQSFYGIPQEQMQAIVEQYLKTQGTQKEEEKKEEVKAEEKAEETSEEAVDDARNPKSKIIFQSDDFDNPNSAPTVIVNKPASVDDEDDDSQQKKNSKKSKKKKRKKGLTSSLSRK